MQTFKRIIVGFLLIFFLSSLTRNLAEYYKNIGFYKEFKADYEKKSKENSKLKTQILKKSDPIEIEKTIRNKLNLAKEHEMVIMVPDENVASPTPSPTPAPVYKQWADVLL